LLKHNDKLTWHCHVTECTVFSIIELESWRLALDSFTQYCGIHWQKYKWNQTSKNIFLTENFLEASFLLTFYNISAIFGGKISWNSIDTGFSNSKRCIFTSRDTQPKSPISKKHRKLYQLVANKFSQIFLWRVLTFRLVSI